MSWQSKYRSKRNLCWSSRTSAAGDLGWKARTGSPINLIDDYAVWAPRAKDGLHLDGVIDARHERSRSPVIAGVDFQSPVAAVPRHHMR